MPLESTIFGAFRSKSTVTCYANWCADSLGARCHFALSGFDFRSFRVSVVKITPGRVAIRAPICLTRTREFLSLMNHLLIQMLGESGSVEIQARPRLAGPFGYGGLYKINL